MAKKTVEQRIRECIADVCGIDSSIVIPSSTLANLEVDSLTGVEILLAVEDELEIYLSDDEADRCTNVGEFIEFVKRNMV